MRTVLILAYSLAQLAVSAGMATAVEPRKPRTYWYGNQLIGDVTQLKPFLMDAALATLSDREQAALATLKASGFQVLDLGPKDIECQPGPGNTRHIIALPRGINLASPPTNEPRKARLTPKEFQALSELRHVQRITLGGNLFDDDALVQLPNMEDLWSLILMHTRITDAGLKKLGPMRKVRYLVIAASAITDEGLKGFAAFPALETIVLESTRISDAGMKELAKHPQIKCINIRGEETGVLAPPGAGNNEADGTIGDVGVAALAAMPNLTTVSVGGSRLTDAGVAVLAEPGSFGKLMNLGIGGPGVTDRSLATMALPGRFAKLRDLNLNNAAVTDAGLKSLYDPAVLPNLAAITLFNTQVTAAGVQALQKARSGLEIMVHFKDGTVFRTRRPAKQAQ